MISGLYQNTKGAERIKEDLMKAPEELIKEQLYSLRSIRGIVASAELPTAEYMDLDEVWKILREEDLTFNDLVDNFVTAINILLNINTILENLEEKEEELYPDE